MGFVFSFYNSYNENSKCFFDVWGKTNCVFSSDNNISVTESNNATRKMSNAEYPLRKVISLLRELVMVGVPLSFDQL